MIKPEVDLELSIKALEVYGIEPNIIKSMLTNLQKVVKQNCNLHVVSQRSELLKAFIRWNNKHNGIAQPVPEKMADNYLKSL